MMRRRIVPRDGVRIAESVAPMGPAHTSRSAVGARTALAAGTSVRPSAYKGLSGICEASKWRGDRFSSVAFDGAGRDVKMPRDV